MVAAAIMLVLATVGTNHVQGFVPQKSTLRTTFGVPSSSLSSSSQQLNMLADDPKVILVTGSSRGLGKSIATDIGSYGHKMIINYVSDGSKEAAEATVAEIKAAGGDAVAIQADCKCFFCLL